MTFENLMTSQDMGRHIKNIHVKYMEQTRQRHAAPRAHFILSIDDTTNKVGYRPESPIVKQTIADEEYH